MRRATAGRILRVVRIGARRADERPGITVATVTWNSLAYLEVLIEAVKHFSSDDVEILVIDNHSTDGTKDYLDRTPGITVQRLPVNIGHGLGLDVALLRARTRHVVILDVDAFPVSADWLDALLDPLTAGSTVAGAHVHRGFIHPCFLGMRRSDYVDLRVSFAPIGIAPDYGAAPRGVFMDVGEALSHNISIARGSKAIHRIPATSARGPGVAGSVFGGVVYHNFYSTQGKSELMDASKQMWEDAVHQYLPWLSGGP